MCRTRLAKGPLTRCRKRVSSVELVEALGHAGNRGNRLEYGWARLTEGADASE
jgi:hypothetical protein